MKFWLKNKIKWFVKDRIQYGVCISALALLLCHIWQYVDSGYMIEPLIRIVFYSILIPSVFVWGRSAIFYLFLIFAYVSTQFITFFNYTPFIIVVIFLMIKTNGNRKRDTIITAVLIVIYVILVIRVCHLHHKHISHLIIHFVNCAFIYTAEFFFVKKKPPKKKLILDDLTKKILSELAAGKMQKEIDFCNKNTITTKLKNAIMDNNLLTKEQLLMRYIAEYIEL